MNQLFERFFLHWKTTSGGALAVAGIVVSSMTTGYPNMKWCPVATAVIAGLTGLLAKD